MPTIPNFLNNQQTPLGAAFANLARTLASGPSDAEKYKQADDAVLSRWKVRGMQGLGDNLAHGFDPAAPAPAMGTGGAPSPIAAAVSRLAPASDASAVQAPGMEGPDAPSPIAAAFANAAPQPAPKPQIDYGDYTRNALFAGVKPDDAGGYLLLGNANTYGARDPRTTNSAAGINKYDNTAEHFDIGQTNDMHKADQTDATSRSNNAATQATSRANNAATIAKDYGVAGMHEVHEDARAKLKGGGVASKQERADQARLSTADIVTDKVAEALKHVGPWTTGMAGSQTSKVAGGEAYTLARTIDTIKANLSFDTLAAMRAASPTGGALGAVSDYENKMLGSTVASLDQGLPEDELRASLEQVNKHYANIKKLINGEPVQSDAPSPAAPAPGAEEHWSRGPDGKLVRTQ